jgi:hypothetical protein
MCVCMCVCKRVCVFICHWDVQGNRTVGVLTKLDLMDPGTDALEVLHGRVIKVLAAVVVCHGLVEA